MKNLSVCLCMICILCTFCNGCVSTKSSSIQNNTELEKSRIVQNNIDVFYSIDQAAKHIAEDLTREWKEDGEVKPYIAIGGFNSFYGDNTLLCRRIEEALSAAFSKDALLTITPEDAEKLKNFYEYQDGEKVDVIYSGGHAIQEAYYLLTGYHDVHENSNKVKILVKMIRTDTGVKNFISETWLDMNNKDISHAANTYISRRKIDKRPVSIDFEFMYSSNHGYSFPKKWELGSTLTLYSDDYYQIKVKPDEDCYLYIFQADSSGNFIRLFPMKTFQGRNINNLNPLAGGQTYTLPGNGISFSLDNNIGTERIYLTALRERSYELENLNSMLMLSKTRGQTEMAKKRANSIFKDLDRSMGKIKDNRYNTPMPADWEKTDQKFSVIDTRINNLGSGKVYVLEFLHK